MTLPNKPSYFCQDPSKNNKACNKSKLQRNTLSQATGKIHILIGPVEHRIPSKKIRIAITLHAGEQCEAASLNTRAASLHKTYWIKEKSPRKTLGGKTILRWEFRNPVWSPRYETFRSKEIQAASKRLDERLDKGTFSRRRSGPSISEVNEQIAPDTRRRSLTLGKSAEFRKPGTQNGRTKED